MEVPSSGYIWTNFDSSSGDVIEVRFSPIDKKFDLYYIINNGPNGSRTDIYDSRNKTFIPRNRCASASCTFRISNFLAEAWGESRAKVFVNDLEVVSDFDGSVARSFTAGQDDGIRIEFNYGGPSDEIGYSLQKLSEPIDYIEWYYNSHGSSAIIPNPYAAVWFDLPAEDNLIVKAGSDIAIQLSSEPQAGSFMVNLKCGILPTIGGEFLSNISDQQTLIPPDHIFTVILDCGSKMTETSESKSGGVELFKVPK